ncbi:hypothetical protein GOB91_09535 [Sinorhizobium meliloti]|uniref:hypothetical protein n=1 Tax=Sinorhizobium TaxID=28105 RepID=UPI0004628694|nr:MULTISPECIES: hypothetical protein [Sinorhizobium]MDW9722560.1 hypothetical protein [Sinorhizobium meliloti]MDW9730776.1 hypothetical protein [Sinorhizobium meliloti]MDW9784900.1 hypothetical protein [Sinorhizobium meliloti]MDX0654375.1 hypothetical protein [Sinorhizobium medicae]MDX0980164.1 hypothetical protein [Sinorhizobium medicae]
MISKRAINILTLIYIFMIIAGAFLAFHLIAPDNATRVPKMTIGDPADKALELATDLTKQLISLATALIGGCIWLITRPLTNDGELVERLIWSLLSLLLFTASMYFGFVEIDASLTSLSLETFDPLDDIVWWPQTLQYYSFVVGAFTLGLACLRSINAIVEKK